MSSLCTPLSMVDARKLLRIVLKLLRVRRPLDLAFLMRRVAARRFRKLVILDLDATLIWAEDEATVPPSHSAVLMAEGKPYWVKKRPHLDAFLAYCFSEYDVAIWSAAPKHYVHAIAHYLGGHRWTFIMSGERCTEHFVLEQHDTVVLKKLAKVWKGKDTRALYRKHNTVIVDDARDTFRDNRGNAIHIQPYIGRNQQDRELLRVGRLLAKIRFVPDVRTVKGMC